MLGLTRKMMVLLWLLLYLWLSVVFLTYPLLVSGLEFLPFHRWDNMVLARSQQAPAHIPGAFSKLACTCEQRPSSFLCDPNNTGKTEEPFNH